MAFLTLDARDPNTIWLSPPLGNVDAADWYSSNALGHYPVITADILPGRMVQLVDDGAGELSWQLHADSSTEQPSFFVAVEQQYLNAYPSEAGKSVDTPYAVGDTLAARPVQVGNCIWAWVDTGQDITGADRLRIAADGFLATAADVTPAANVAHFQALESTGGAVAEPTRIRVMRFN